MKNHILLRKEIYHQHKYYIYCRKLFEPHNQPDVEDFINAIVVSEPFCAICSSELDINYFNNGFKRVTRCTNIKCSFKPCIGFPAFDSKVIRYCIEGAIEKNYHYFWQMYSNEYNRLISITSHTSKLSRINLNG